MDINSLCKLLGENYAMAVIELVISRIRRSQIADMVRQEAVSAKNVLLAYKDYGLLKSDGDNFYINLKRLRGSDAAVGVVELSEKINYYNRMRAVSIIMDDGKEAGNEQE